MQLSKFGDYGFRVLIYAGTKKSLCTTSEISKAFGISQNHLVKIVHRLEKLGYLKTKKGKKGGFTLSQDPSEILIGNAFQSIEKNLDLVECFSEEMNQCVINDNCRLKHIFHRALEQFVVCLNRYTLKDLLQPTKQLEKILLKNWDQS